MGESAKLKISPAVAACIGPEALRSNKLSAARGEQQFTPREFGIVMFYLCHDADEEIKTAARSSMLGLPLDLLLAMVDPPDIHPRVIDLIARCHFRKPALFERLISHPAITTATSTFLTENAPPQCIANFESAATEPITASTEQELPDDEEDYDSEPEEHHNKYQMAQIMGVGDKIKMALTGDKEWRSILIKDSNKQVSGAVIKNPRITDGEVLVIAKSSIQNDEILRVICHNKEWLKNHQIRKAMVENHRTPLQTALRFLATLGDKEIASLAKSKSVSSVISTQARRLLLQKKKD